MIQSSSHSCQCSVRGLLLSVVSLIGMVSLTGCGTTPPSNPGGEVSSATSDSTSEPSKITRSSARRTVELVRSTPHPVDTISDRIKKYELLPYVRIKRGEESSWPDRMPLRVMSRTNLPMLLDGNHLLVFRDGNIVCRHTGDKRTLWKHEGGSATDMIAHTKNTVAVYKPNGSIRAIDLHSGTFLWKSSDLPGDGMLAAGPDQFWVYNQNKVVGLRAGDGTKQFQSSFPHEGESDQPSRIIRVEPMPGLVMIRRRPEDYFRFSLEFYNSHTGTLRFTTLGRFVGYFNGRAYIHSWRQGMLDTMDTREGTFMNSIELREYNWRFLRTEKDRLIYSTFESWLQTEPNGEERPPAWPGDDRVERTGDQFALVGSRVDERTQTWTATYGPTDRSYFLRAHGSFLLVYRWSEAPEQHFDRMTVRSAKDGAKLFSVSVSGSNGILDCTVAEPYVSVLTADGYLHLLRMKR